jgi:histidine triad (HIT) family protein
MKVEDCLFCKIATGTIPSKKVYEDSELFAFHDISPVAPTHILIIPKKHIASLSEISEDDAGMIAQLFGRIRIIAHELGIERQGFRVVNNCGEYGGQTVHHLHFHILGGRQLKWPPG